MSRQNVRLLLGLIALIVMFKACEREPGEQSERETRAERAAKQVDQELTPQKPIDPTAVKDGLAAAIAIDVSGSMDEEVGGLGGRKEAKIAIARRAALDLVEQFARYAADHQDEPVLLGIYEFSRRRGEPDCRTVIAMAPPDRERAAAAIAKLDADGGTPIGQAMITAKRALDESALTRRHLLVVTDGENTDGFQPDVVARAIGKRPEVERPSLYFVAFDVEASRFTRVRDAGALLLSAGNASELTTTLDALLRGNILVEK